MFKNIHIAIVSGFFLLVTNCFAQEMTISDLVKKGGRKLTKDELTTLVSGATIEGRLIKLPNAKGVYEYKADGTLTGRNVTGMGKAIGVWGMWSVTDRDVLCYEATTSQRESFKVCNIFFKLGATYYAAIPGDRTNPVFERDISR